jgi:hypothetical protein
MSDAETVTRCERLAEAAYAAMYEARPHQVKDLYEEARGHFWRAIEAAWQGRLFAEVVRLAQRFAEVDAVYNGQFRGIGR